MSELYTSDGGAETGANADSLPVDFGDARAEPVEPGEPEDPLDLVGLPSEFDEPVEPEGEREPLELSAREEGPEGVSSGRCAMRCPGGRNRPRKQSTYTPRSIGRTSMR